MQPRARAKAKNFHESKAFKALMMTLLALALVAVSYTHLTLPTIYSV